MMKLISLIMKRPKDSTIMYGMIFLGTIVPLGLYFNLIVQADALETTFFWQELSTSAILVIKYVFIVLSLIPLYLWLTRQCLMKKKHMRIFQVAFWILLFYMSSKVVEWPKLDVDVLLFLLAFPPILAGITGKCIFSTCLKHKEKIQKIRV